MKVIFNYGKLGFQIALQDDKHVKAKMLVS